MLATVKHQRWDSPYQICAGVTHPSSQPLVGRQTLILKVNLRIVLLSTDSTELLG